MADVKISELTAADPLTGAELIALVQSGITTNAALSELRQWLAQEFVESSDVANIVTLTQAEYDALGTPDPATLYVIVE